MSAENQDGVVGSPQFSASACSTFITLTPEHFAELCQSAKSAGERWKEYEAERQNHDITKRDLRRAIDALEYYLDNGDCHNAITKAREAVESTVILPLSNSDYPTSR